MKQLNIGDRVYVPSYEYTSYTEICTVCFGKKKVQVILGNDEIVEVDCNACNESYGPPRGYINVRGYKENIILVTISGKEITENLDGINIEYRYNENYCLKESNCFLTKDEAEKRLKEIILEKEDYDRKNYLDNKNKKLMNLTWSIRYHTSQAKDCENNMNRHREKVQYIKTINKPLGQNI